MRHVLPKRRRVIGVDVAQLQRERHRAQEHAVMPVREKRGRVLQETLRELGHFLHDPDGAERGFFANVRVLDANSAATSGATSRAISAVHMFPSAHSPRPTMKWFLWPRSFLIEFVTNIVTSWSLVEEEHEPQVPDAFLRESDPRR